MAKRKSMSKTATLGLIIFSLLLFILSLVITRNSFLSSTFTYKSNAQESRMTNIESMQAIAISPTIKPSGSIFPTIRLSGSPTPTPRIITPTLSPSGGPTSGTCIPQLYAPLGGSVVTTGVGLTWSSQCPVRRYFEVVIMDRNKNIIKSQIVDKTIYSPPSSLFSKASFYWWKVRSCDTCSTTSCINPSNWWSQEWGFWWQAIGPSPSV